MIEFIAKARLPTCFGKFDIYSFRDGNGKEHVALVRGKIRRDKTALVRIHSKCLTGDTLCSLRCDCRKQLEISMKIINKTGGVLLYLDQEGRGIGLSNKIRAYELQDKGADTVEANEMLGLPIDMRNYRVAAEMLGYLGIKSIALITNNPKKLTGLEGDGIDIVERIALNTKPNKFNRKYLETKKRKMGHL